MKTVHKEYRPIEGNKHLRIEIYYSLGGMNFFTYKTEPRGYYASVSPVTLEQRDGYTSESFMAFSGTKKFLLEAKRRSDKAAKQAIALFTEALKEEMCNLVLGKQSLRTDRLSIERKLNVCIPPRYEGLSETQILKLPVKIVRCISGNFMTEVHKNLAVALDAVPDIHRLNGGMYDTIEGVDGLRFEDSKATDILSN